LKAAYGTPVSISGRLTFSACSGSAATAVTVTRTHVGGSTASLGKVTGTANGAFISKAASGAALTASASGVTAGTTVHLTVKLPKIAGPARTIDIYAASAGEPKKLVKSANSDFNAGTVATTIRVTAK
jgi:hypothetical protein